MYRLSLGRWLISILLVASTILLANRTAPTLRTVQERFVYNQITDDDDDNEIEMEINDVNKEEDDGVVSSSRELLKSVDDHAEDAAEEGNSPSTSAIEAKERLSQEGKQELYEEETAPNSNSNEQQQPQTHQSTTKQQDPPLTSSSNIPSDLSLSLLLTHKGLRDQLTKARTNFQKRMHTLYGEKYYEVMFEPPTNDGTTRSVGYHFIHKSAGQLKKKSMGKRVETNGKSWYAMVRKLQIKLYQVQLGILQQQLQKQQLQQQEQQKQKQNYYAQYIWMTSGDNSAAGFGNLFHQTYTSVLQEALQPVFANVGIEFIARNHAFRGQESAPEVALCGNALFGTKFDSLVWGFDTEDNKEVWQRSFYAHRAAVIANDNVPALIMHSDLASNHRGDTLFIAKQLEQLGMPVLINDPKAERSLLLKAPDCTYLTDQQIKDTIPPNLQFFRCGQDIEKNSGKKGGRGTGEGHCSNHHHDRSVCRKRADLKDWNPGWKTHAVRGYWYALTMMELLSDAIEAIGRDEPIDTNNLSEAISGLETKLDQFLKDEAKDYQPMKVSNNFAISNHWLKQEDKLDTRQHFNLTALLHSPTICRTPLMPSDSRLRGIFSNKLVAYGEGFEEGIPLQQQQQTTATGNSSDNEIPVMTNPNERGGCKEAGIYTTQEKSFRDFFQVKTTDSSTTQQQPEPQSLIIPNDAEQHHYKDFDINKSNGWIIICLGRCFGGTKCVETMILQNKISNGRTQIVMDVNGVRVSGFGKFLTQPGFCRALKHDGRDEDDPTNHQHQYKWTPNQQGKYEIRIQLKDTYPSLRSKLKITSFILM